MNVSVGTREEGGPNTVGSAYDKVNVNTMREEAKKLDRYACEQSVR
jgi:hypothetical protein